MELGVLSDEKLYLNFFDLKSILVPGDILYVSPFIGK